MPNLLHETIEVLAAHGYDVVDVLCVMDKDKQCTWREFAAQANKNYDNGYGGAEVNMMLKIVGRDWWLSRGEYDGSEWWEMNHYPTALPIGDVEVWAVVND